MMMDSRKHWEEHWRWLTKAGHRYNTKEYLQFCAGELMLYLPEQAREILELGCGDGVLYEFMKDRFASYFGLDFSMSMLSKFRSREKGLRIIQADASNIPFRPKPTFDFVFCNGLFQYLDREMILSNFRQIH